MALLQQRLAPGHPLEGMLFDGEELVKRCGAPPSASCGWPRWGGAATVMGALAVILGLRAAPRSVDVARPGDARPALQERGASGPSGSSPFEGVRAFCLVRDSAGIASVGESASSSRPPASTTLRCRLGDALQFAYSAAIARHLLLVGVGPDGQLLFYSGDHGRESGSFPVAAGAREQPLPDSTRLIVHHRPGATQVLGLFADHAITHDAVVAALGRGGVAAVRALADDPQALTLEVLP